MDFSRYVAEHVIPLDTIDDLEPLAASLETARVIAIGENAHLVREFYQLRHRLHRFLAQKLGFTVYAMESGFSEGFTVDAWVRGERPADDLRSIADENITYTMGRCAEMRDHLTWMRSATPPARFFGLDVPGSTASPLPAIEGLRRYLRRVDPDAEQVLDRVAALAGAYAGEHSLLAYTAYSALAVTERDRLTAMWAELTARFDALEPEYRAAGGDEAYAVARHELRLAVLLDQAMRGYAAQVSAEGGIPTVHPRVAARDRGIAETVFWLLDRLGPDAKIIVAAHNNHIQRTPVHTPVFPLSAAGHHLATRLGPEYVAVGVTCTGGRTVTHRADPGAPGGVAIIGADLAAPEAGSIEAALPVKLCAVDLRPARAAGVTKGPDRIRIIDRYQQSPIIDAFDLVINIPEVTPVSHVNR
ncbi:erythromycin esterase family protein [Actinoplanes couchii]|uniref:Erythromycin esterase n=1 Tax=Actinoplanes couchii TaxID=403638 RepID=A0ABQ3XPT0_9ACTN|nr:erythromycin esterase family protein [Actinoplanes couchii]MDR6319159.1 erythromycin esterase [Actinoplanes couchii]GID60499.1 erythromycin esterase [Actinoplanes couchii]